MAWEDWENKRTRRFWNEVLDILEETTRAVIQKHSQSSSFTFDLTRTRWDSPDVELYWESGNICRNVHIQVQNKSWPVQLMLTGAAWVDLTPPGPGNRRAIALGPKVGLECADRETLYNFAKINIEKMFELICELKELQEVKTG